MDLVRGARIVTCEYGQEWFVSNIRSIEGSLYRLAFSILKNVQDSEDALSEATLKAYKYRHRLKDKGAFKAWMSKIVIREAYKILKKNKRIISMPLEECEEIVSDDGLHGELIEIIKTFSPDLATVLILFYYEKYTVKAKTPIPKQDEQEDVAWLYAPGMELKIDGRNWEYMGNGQDQDAYLEDECTLKGMQRINVAHLQLPEAFELEIRFINPCGKQGEWIITIPVQKIAADTHTVVVDKTYQIHTKSYCTNHDGKTTFDLNIDKVIFSPLASQLVITEYNVQDDAPFENFVLFDQDGNSLDMITQWVGITEEKSNESTNGFEFIPTENLEKIVIVPITRYEREEEIKAGVTYDEQYRHYEEEYPIKLEIPIEEIPVKISRGPLINYEIIDLQLQEDTMLLQFKVNGPPVDQLLKTVIYPLDENKKWLANTRIKSLSVDRETGIYTLRWTNAKKEDQPVDVTKTKYLTLDDSGYLLPEQLLWDQAIEIDVSQP